MASRYVVEATKEHTERVAALMREADREEVWAMSRLTPAQAMRESVLQASVTWAALSPGTGEAFAVFGVGARSMLSETGVPWLLATDEIREYCVPFAKHCREYVGYMLERYPVLENYVDGRNRLSRAWLRWCGFRIDKEPTVINDVDFYRFTHKRSSVCA